MPPPVAAKLPLYVYGMVRDREMEASPAQIAALQTRRAEVVPVLVARHLGHLDAVADEFFGTEQARDAVRQKVTALFPAHEVDEFTELFYGRIQQWRAAEGRTG